MLVERAILLVDPSSSSSPWAVTCVCPPYFCYLNSIVLVSVTAGPSFQALVE